MEIYIGLDVHSKETTYCIQNELGDNVAVGEFETTPGGIQAFVEKFDIAEQTKVGLETGTVSFFVSRQLAMAGLEPIVVNAHEVRQKAHRSRQKSDSRDAEEICHGIRTGMYRSIIHVPPKTITLIRETLKRRRHFVRTAARQITAVKALLRGAGLRRITVALKSSDGWHKLIEKLAPMPELQLFVDQHRILWKAARSQIAKTEAQLGRLGKPFETELVRLQQVPGVGPIVALTTLAALSDPHRFPSAKHVSSYGGVVPSTSQSGEVDRHGHITKAGNPELRSMLCEAAHHAAKSRNPFNPMFRKLCAKRGYKIAIMAVAHRLLRIMWAMLKNETDFDPTKLGLEEGPFVVKRVRHYRLRKTAS